LEHPGIGEAAVVGVKDDAYGEAVGVVVAAAAGGAGAPPPTLEELRAWRGRYNLGFMV
jgi:long-chain acyl-CoA synthetase